MRESSFTRFFQLQTHYYTTYGLAVSNDRVHIKVMKITPPSLVAAWLFKKRSEVEELPLRVPYERIHRLHDLISRQTEAYFDKKKRRSYARVTQELDQFVQETRSRAV